MTGLLFVENRGVGVTGDVFINNTGLLEIQSLKNVGNITFTNTDSIKINPGSIDSGYNAIGSLLSMELLTGSFLGLGAPDMNKPDITAYSATFFGAKDSYFGSITRPLVLRVNDRLIIGTRQYTPPIYTPRPPRSVTITSELQVDFNNISAERLIEIEELEDINPAIFTDVRNYTYGQVAVRLPDDQLFENERDEGDN